MTDDTRAYLKATLAKMGVTDHEVCVYSNGDAEANG